MGKKELDKIFKTYDIRGIYPKQINKETVKKIAQAYVQYIDAKEIVVGHDARTSSPEFKEAFIEAARAQNCDVIDVGLCSSPMFYFILNFTDKPGAMITASHNPKEYNGIKLCRNNAVSLWGDELQEIKELIPNIIPPGSKNGQLKKLDFHQEYINFILKQSQKIKPLHVVIDFSNGVAGKIEKPILEETNIKITSLFEEPDGNFPNHSPDPTHEENLKQLKEKVKEEKADLGFIFDGDADRVIFVDENSKVISPDIITALLTKHLIEDKAGEKVIFDLISSKVVKETIEFYGGKPVISKVGHSYIKHLMREEDAIFAGETSGHYYFRDFHYCDSAILTILKVLELLSQENKTFSILVKPFQKYTHLHKNLQVKNKKAIIKNVKKEYKNHQQDDLDGLTVKSKKWWFNLRPSHTEDILRLNVEADTRSLAAKKIKEVQEFINRQKDL